MPVRLKIRFARRCTYYRNAVVRWAAEIGRENVRIGNLLFKIELL